ncbi:MAG: siderophore-interacting protein [Opitutaceae bacterium]|nr:siderophore-interacting protein [Opitutaceae bacterium]
MNSDETIVRRVRHPLKIRRLAVKRVAAPTPRVRRITLAGPELDGLVTLAPEDHVKVFLPAPGARLPVLPVVTPEGRIAPPAEGGRPVARDYTLRRHDAAAGELDIDFFLHGGGGVVGDAGGGENGVASAWAARARPGDVVGIGGPRGSHVMAEVFDWYLLVGDETALPAIARRLEEFEGVAPQTRAFAVIVVADEAGRQALRAPVAGGVTWVVCPPDTVGTAAGRAAALTEAVRGLPFPDGRGFAWVAGEVTEARAVALHLLGERDFVTSRMNVSGHWKRGVSNHDHHAPVIVE